LYWGIQDQKYEYFEIVAGLLGVDVKGETKKKEESFLFKDPKEYEKMPDEKRKELTEKMMNKHKLWASDTSIGDRNA
jgi:hypothetical protein